MAMRPFGRMGRQKGLLLRSNSCGRSEMVCARAGRMAPRPCADHPMVRCTRVSAILANVTKLGSNQIIKPSV